MNDIDDYLKDILEPEECEEKIKTKNITEENISYSDYKPCTTGFVLSTPKWIEPEKMARMYEEFRHPKTDEDYIKEYEKRGLPIIYSIDKKGNKTLIKIRDY